MLFEHFTFLHIWSIDTGLKYVFCEINERVGRADNSNLFFSLIPNDALFICTIYLEIILHTYLF